MTQSIPKLQVMTLAEFLDWYPDGLGCFELHDGVVIEMQPTGAHEQVAAELSTELSIESRRLKLFFPFTKCWMGNIQFSNIGRIKGLNL